MKAKLEKQGISFTDLEPVIRELKNKDDKKWYFPVDGHFTKYAHKRLARYMIKELNITK